MTSIILEKTSNGCKTLNLKVRHINGLYRFSCIQEIEENGFVNSFMFATGNFNFTITNGRKSDKKLKILNQIIDNIANQLVDLWKNNQYQDMCNLIYNEAIKQKVA